MKWCPSADCTYAIKVQCVEPKPVACTCGHIFCFECGENWHDAVQCRLLRKWIKKCDDDSETSNWIAANTKECPKCNITIEKDGGCNHMVSRVDVNCSLLIKFSLVCILLFHFRSAKTKIANMISVGFAWVHGNRTVRLGTIVIDTMKTRHVLPVMPKRSFDHLWRGMIFYYFFVVDIFAVEHTQNNRE